MSSPSADKPTSQPARYVSARGFAIGVALAAVATVVLRGHVIPIDDPEFALDAPAIAVGCAIAAPSGLAGGWLVWRGSGVRPHVSLWTAIGVAIGASLLSIWIACGILGVEAAVEGAIATGRLRDAYASVMGGLFAAPLFFAVWFGPTLLGLVTAWSLVWRWRVNR